MRFREKRSVGVMRRMEVIVAGSYFCCCAASVGWKDGSCDVNKQPIIRCRGINNSEKQSIK